jgi:molybdenum cofactor guanylyltransferase
MSPWVPSFSAVILAGGASRRMGRDKSLLAVDGQTLLEWQVATARAAGAQEVLISGRPGVDYSALGCRVLLDQYRECGPLAGIERGLSEATENLVLCMAVDMPKVRPDMIGSLLAQCSPERGVVPVLYDQLEPLLAVYPKCCGAATRAMLEARRLVVSEFACACVQAGAVQLYSAPGEAAAQFANWNHPEDVDEQATRMSTMICSARIARCSLAISSTLPCDTGLDAACTG